jgi:hypothetical protein
MKIARAVQLGFIAFVLNLQAVEMTVRRTSAHKARLKCFDNLKLHSMKKALPSRTRSR